MPDNPLPPQHKSLLFLLESCTSIRNAFQIQAQLFVTGLHHQRLFLSKLISFLSLSSQATAPSSLSHSLLIFSRLRRPNVFIYNTLIRAFARSKTPSDSVSIYKDMVLRGHTSPNSFTFPFLISSCSKLSRPESGLQVHCHVMKLGFDSDVHVGNSLVGFYTGFGDLALARNVFDEISEWDRVSFNVMMNGYVKGGEVSYGLWLFEDMVGLGVKPDVCTFVCLMSVCVALDDLKGGKAVHMLALKDVGFGDYRNDLMLALVDMYAKMGTMKMAERVFSRISAGGKSVAIWSCMVSGYAKCGEIAIARRMFDEMPEKDLISWTSMISGYTQNERYREALELYEEMQKERIKPDAVTLVALLSACAHSGNLDLGKRLHVYVEKEFPSSHNNSKLCTAIVDMYGKCGCVGTALEIFDRVDKELKTTSLLNSMICGLAQHGLGERAVAIFTEMESLGLKPDEVTFVGVLCACSHSGLIEEGKEFFGKMVKTYNIHPQIEHYGCIIDLLGRGGYVDEAYALIKNMPISPNHVIWASLRRNCRVHKNSKLEEIAESKLLQLGSNGNSPLIEMFLDAASPENAKKVKKLTNYKPKWKQQGCSYIEFDGFLQEFQPNTSSYPQLKEIDLMLEQMRKRLRLSIYDNIISNHSEWLALAFGLINLARNETIRIIMDLRMCSDCHLWFKLFSKEFRREIVVRDKIRFHHMKNGLCSCMD